MVKNRMLKIAWKGKSHICINESRDALVSGSGFKVHQSFKSSGGVKGVNRQALW